MAKATMLKINNSKNAAVSTGKWSNPGAKFYDILLDAFYFPTDEVDNPDNLYPADFIKEAYLIAPIKDIKNSPYGRTPFSRSGCKYPHHSIVNGELVVNVAGIKAAYSRAKQNGDFKGAVKEHLIRHYKELGMYENSTLYKESVIFYMQESASTLNPNYQPKGSIDLSSLKKVHITEALINEYKNKYPCLRHVRCKDTKDYTCDGYCWFKDFDLVCMVGSCTYRDTGEKYIASLEVLADYNGYGLGRQILDYAVKEMGCTKLSVNKNNQVAKKMYDDYGFKEFQSNSEMIYMVYVKPNENQIPGMVPDVTKFAKTPKELSDWMKANIQYDKSIRAWKFKSPGETFKLRLGNCHDQAAFAQCTINNLNRSRYKAERLFFIEYNEGSNVGGNTHTLCYYYDLNEKNLYWFENAWETQAGIHGPYKNLEELKSDIIEVYKHDDDINSHMFEFIVFGTSNNATYGISLGEYVESQVLETNSDGELDGYVVNSEIVVTESPMYFDEFDDASVFTEATEEQNDDKEESLPKQADREESNKNGVERKQLYMEFIEYAKGINNKNTFGSVFDKMAFKTTYTFVPHELRYFYRLANPLLCVLENELTFFSLAELGKINKDNPHRDKMLIFASNGDSLRVFNSNDKLVYKATEEQLKSGKLVDKIGASFDSYIEKIIGKKVLTVESE